MPRLLPLAARKALYKRIEHVLLTDPMTSTALAQRFGVGTDVIRRLAKKLGVKLPHGEYPSCRSTARYKQRWSKSWGSTGRHG